MSQTQTLYSGLIIQTVDFLYL